MSDITAAAVPIPPKNEINQPARSGPNPAMLRELSKTSDIAASDACREELGQINRHPGELAAGEETACRSHDEQSVTLADQKKVAQRD
jgi:hypothetical protein